MQNHPISKNNLHLVTICDEDGIFEAFDSIKAQLSVKYTSILTLIYALSGSSPHAPFTQELSILEKHFSGKLYVHKLNADSITYCISGIVQEFLEALINTNLSPCVEFTIFGDEDFACNVSDILHFLNVKPACIQSIISEQKK